MDKIKCTKLQQSWDGLLACFIRGKLNSYASAHGSDDVRYGSWNSCMFVFSNCCKGKKHNTGRLMQVFHFKQKQQLLSIGSSWGCTQILVSAHGTSWYILYLRELSEHCLELKSDFHSFPRRPATEQACFLHMAVNSLPRQASSRERLHFSTSQNSLLLF